MGTTLATKQDLQRLASKQDVLLLRQEMVLLRQELLGNRAQFRRQSENGHAQLLGSIDTFYGDITRKLAEFERKLTMRFGVMFFSGCGLTIAAIRGWI